MAAGILEVSAWNQANALRRVTVKRGLDARDFTLVSFGGSGSLSACRLVDLLGLRGVLVPPDPGNLSAYGLLTVDVRNDYVRTYVRRHDAVEPASIASAFAALGDEAGEALAREGFPPTARMFARSADLRYFGQAFEVRVDVPDGKVDRPLLDAVAAAFHAEHRRLYGYDFAGDVRQQVEWVNLRVTGIGPIPRPAQREVGAGAGSASARTGTRRAYFDGWQDAALYDRYALGAGDAVTGPAILEEFGATVPVHPGFTATVDTHANLSLVRRAPSTAATRHRTPNDHVM